MFRKGTYTDAGKLQVCVRLYPAPVFFTRASILTYLILQLYTSYISPIPISITIAKSKGVYIVKHRTEIFLGTKVHKDKKSSAK